MIDATLIAAFTAIAFMSFCLGWRACAQFDQHRTSRKIDRQQETFMLSVLAGYERPFEPDFVSIARNAGA